MLREQRLTSTRQSGCNVMRGEAAQAGGRVTAKRGEVREGKLGQAGQSEKGKAKAEAEANAALKAEGKEGALKKAAMKDLFGEGSDTSRAGTPANGIDTPKKKKSGTNTPQNGVKGPIGALKKNNLEDDVMGDLDLGIDIEI